MRMAGNSLSVPALSAEAAVFIPGCTRIRSISPLPLTTTIPYQALLMSESVCSCSPTTVMEWVGVVKDVLISIYVLFKLVRDLFKRDKGGEDGTCTIASPSSLKANPCLPQTRGIAASARRRVKAPPGPQLVSQATPGPTRPLSRPERSIFR